MNKTRSRVKLKDRFDRELNQRVCESLALGEKSIESRAEAIESGNKRWRAEGDSRTRTPETWILL